MIVQVPSPALAPTRPSNKMYIVCCISDYPTLAMSLLEEYLILRIVDVYLIAFQSLFAPLVHPSLNLINRYLSNIYFTSLLLC